MLLEPAVGMAVETSGLILRVRALNTLDREYAFAACPVLRPT